jgi:hypothetical protein
MTAWYEVYNDVFFIAVAGLVVGVIGVCVRACIKCKWISFDACCIHITRNPELENEEQKGDSPNISSKSNLYRKQNNYL